jgi:hypothetical protein
MGSRVSGNNQGNKANTKHQPAGGKSILLYDELQEDVWKTEKKKQQFPQVVKTPQSGHFIPLEQETEKPTTKSPQSNFFRLDLPTRDDGSNGIFKLPVGTKRDSYSPAEHSPGFGWTNSRVAKAAAHAESVKKEAAAAAAAQQRNEDDKKSRDQSHGAQHRQAQQSNQESTFRGEQSRGRESEQVRVDVDVNLGQADEGLGAQGQQQAIPANLDQKGPLPAEVQGWTTAISPKRRKGYDSPRQKSKKADQEGADDLQPHEQVSKFLRRKSKKNKSSDAGDLAVENLFSKSQRWNKQNEEEDIDDNKLDEQEGSRRQSRRSRNREVTGSRRQRGSRRQTNENQGEDEDEDNGTTGNNRLRSPSKRSRRARSRARERARKGTSATKHTKRLLS